MLENIKKRLKFFRGPLYLKNDRVLITESKGFLKLTRLIDRIGWNPAGGFFFYSLHGIKDQLFREDELTNVVDTQAKQLLFDEMKKTSQLFHNRLTLRS